MALTDANGLRGDGMWAYVESTFLLSGGGGSVADFIIPDCFACSYTSGTYETGSVDVGLANNQAQNQNDPTAPPPPPTPDPAGVRTDSAPGSNPGSPTTSSPSDQTQAPMESRGGQGKGERGQTSKPDNPAKGAKPVRDKDGKITGWLLPTPDGKGKEKGLDWGRANGLDPAKFQNAANVVTVGVIIYWVVSEGSRFFFPPRNLIPIP